MHCEERWAKLFTCKVVYTCKPAIRPVLPSSSHLKLVMKVSSNQSPPPPSKRSVSTGPFLHKQKHSSSPCLLPTEAIQPHVGSDRRESMSHKRTIDSLLRRPWQQLWNWKGHGAMIWESSSCTFGELGCYKLTHEGLTLDIFGSFGEEVSANRSDPSAMPPDARGL